MKKLAHQRLYDQVKRMGPMVLRNTNRNRLLASVREAVLKGAPINYKILSADGRDGAVLLWIQGQEAEADRLAVRYGQHLPHKQRKTYIPRE